ncbi:DUF1214 domain-containing protein [Aminobacter sp. NyZ550]|uniref:DUF1214 domain-containing protein n=1 Tax=Aminobacter ciceronei TaxID=150723 RepID=A0ABR6CEA6_9HYPH|nr:MULTISPECIES: DUF1214 domain-containing protein [Aminobacter]MBA8909179.1 hypothetical protein [Aminobacter ciceronei]MBA9022963.1 hypothetical protein [Aminobacter ciceronei]WAX94574.1 DUF1214 domain-containing protein [Aminobacter sp. NyZ550]WMC98580.1 DUF1214 domain-containing protein [Aminobacter aminovorans]
MLKQSILIALAIAIAVGGGAASVGMVLNSQEGIGAVSVGPWTAFPDIGTPEADPYSKARVARDGVLALGRAEGLSFVADRDSAGVTLKSECNYRIEGSLPVARFWTLYATDRAHIPLKSGIRRDATLHSLEVLRQPDNSISVAVGTRPEPGNWLSVTGVGAMNLVLTFYDTPIASSTGLSGIEMPRIVRVQCNA